MIRSDSAWVGETTSVRLTFETETGQIFRPPTDGAQPLEIIWRPLDGGREPLRQHLRAALPLVVVPEPKVKLDLDLSAPTQPGRYSLQVRGAYFSAERDLTVAPGRER